MSNNNKFKIVVEDHAPFVGDIKSNIMSSDDLADKLICPLFGGVWDDFYGCKIRPTTAADGIHSSIAVDIYFKEMPNADQERCAISRVGKAPTTGNANDMTAKFMAMVAMNATPCQIYKVQDKVYEALSDFVPNNAPINWKGKTMEKTFQTNPYMNSREEVFVCIQGLDLNKVLSLVYGTRDEDGTYQYRADLVRPIPGETEKFIVNVQQIDVNTPNEIYRMLGVYVQGANNIHTYNR